MTVPALPLLPVPGDIHTMGLIWPLATGAYRQEQREGLILHTEHVDSGARVVWQLMQGHGADWLPLGDTFDHTFPTASWPAGAIQWERLRTPTVTVSLTTRIGHYQPRDPTSNAVEHLAEGALRRLAASRTPDVVRRDLRETAGRIAALPPARDALIREGLALNVKAVDLAEDSGLTRQRINQIKNEMGA